jgi:hypothetical protein
MMGLGIALHRVREDSLEHYQKAYESSKAKCLKTFDV